LSENRPLHALVTGGTGYIGRNLVRLLLDDRCFVTIIGRKPLDLGDSNVRFFCWVMGTSIPDVALDPTGEFGPIDCIFHLAHDRLQDTEVDRDVNLTSIHHFLKIINEGSIKKFILASSVAANPEALNRFGRIKAEMTDAVLQSGHIVARIGMVFGGEELGLWGTMSRLVRSTPVLPMISPKTLVQPIHISEVCEGLLLIAKRKQSERRTFALAASKPVSFAEFLKAVSKLKYRRPIFVLPIPLNFALLAAKLINGVPFLSSRIDEQRILGLAGLDTIDSKDDLRVLGLELRDYRKWLKED